jgi:hypothetical protein
VAGQSRERLKCKKGKKRMDRIQAIDEEISFAQEKGYLCLLDTNGHFCVFT